MPYIYNIYIYNMLINFNKAIILNSLGFSRKKLRKAIQYSVRIIRGNNRESKMEM